MRAFSSSSLLVLLVAQVVLAQDDPPKTVLPAGEIELQQLVRLVAQTCRYNILIDERELVADPRPIELTEPVPIDPETGIETLTSLLYTRGFGLMPVDEEKGIYEVVAMLGMRDRELANCAVFRTPEQVLAAPDSKRWVTTILPLQHQNATVMANVLRPMFAASRDRLTLASTATHDGLTIRGPQCSVATAMQLVQENDKPAVATVAEPRLQDRIDQLEEQVREQHRQFVKLQRQIDGLQAELAKLRQAGGK
jgi:hypothetical protein